MHESLFDLFVKERNMLSDTTYDGSRKGTGIGGQRSLRARLALLRRKDKRSREAEGRAQSELSARPLNALEGPPKNIISLPPNPRPSRHQPSSYKFRLFNHTSLPMNPGQDYIDHSIYLTIH
jgi:hypothetical protein